MQKRTNSERSVQAAGLDSPVLLLLLATIAAEAVLRIRLAAQRAAVHALDAALERLAKASPNKAELVSLRFFGGLTVDEVATTLRIAPRTVALDWQMARAWLREQMRREAGDEL